MSGAGGCSLPAYILPSVVQHQRRVREYQASNGHTIPDGYYNGEPVYLAQWSNVSAVLGNNQASNGHTIPDGYYNVCELNGEVFELLGTELRLHAPTRSVSAVWEEAPGLKQPAGQTPWIYSKYVETR